MNLNFIEKICIPADGKKGNEDDLYFHQKAAFVVDGATGLGNPLIQGWDSDAVWFVRTFKAAFGKYIDKGESISDALYRASEETCGEFHGILADANIGKHQVPSAVLALASVHNDTLTLNRMGDCEIHCLLKDGNIWSFPPSPLEALDQHSINLLHKELMAGKTYAEARNAIKSTLIKHRSKMNTPAGYSALSTNLDCLRYIETKEIPVTNVSKILLCSDGFSSAFNNYKLCSINDLLLSENLSLRHITEQLREVERNDSGLLKYPRLKPQDDCTAMLITIE